MTTPRLYKILIADDDIAICESLQFALHEEGYDPFFTTDGKTLYSIRKRNRPDLILLDLWMSGHDGNELCTYLKSKEETKDIPIIIMSARKDVEFVAQEAKADDFIAKPFSLYELYKKIDTLLPPRTLSM